MYKTSQLILVKCNLHLLKISFFATKRDQNTLKEQHPSLKLICGHNPYNQDVLSEKIFCVFSIQLKSQKAFFG